MLKSIGYYLIDLNIDIINLFLFGSSAALIPLIQKRIKYYTKNEFITDRDDIEEIIEELNEKQSIFENFKNLSKIKNIVCKEKVIIKNCNISEEISNIKTKYLSITDCNIKKIGNLDVERLKISRCNIKKIGNLDVEQLKISQCNIENDLYLKNLKVLHLSENNMLPEEQILCYFKYLHSTHKKGSIKLIENVKRLELDEYASIYLKVNFTEIKNVEKVLFTGNKCDISNFTYTKNIFILPKSSNERFVLPRSSKCFITNYKEKHSSNFETIRIIEGVIEHKTNLKYFVNVKNLRLNSNITRLDCLGNIKILNLCLHHTKIKKFSNYSYLYNNIEFFSFTSDKDIGKKKLNLPNNLILVGAKTIVKSYFSSPGKRSIIKYIKFRYVTKIKKISKKERRNQNIYL